MWLSFSQVSLKKTCGGQSAHPEEADVSELCYGMVCMEVLGLSCRPHLCARAYVKTQTSNLMEGRE